MWTRGEYPSSWREAIVVPLLKSGKDPNSTSSYRPISLTCCLSKILEKMVNNRLVHVLESRGLIVPYQAGFRKRHSTIDHLVRLENAVQDAFLDRKHLVAVFFDLEKAYDMTWRYGILQKLHGWGLRGRLPLFIKSFMAQRYFRVRVGDAYSSLHSLENGIPQGSTISVTLFAIAVNDIAASVKSPINSCLYVDDLAYTWPAIPSLQSPSDCRKPLIPLPAMRRPVDFDFRLQKRPVYIFVDCGNHIGILGYTSATLKLLASTPSAF